MLTIVQALLLGATAGITFRIAAHAFGVPIARNAARLLLLNPWLYWMTTVPMCVLLQMALCTGFLFLLFVRRGGVAAASTAAACATGAVAAALALIHAAMLLSVAMLLAGAALLELRRGPAGLRRIGVAAAVTIVGIAPWTARNWAVFDRFMPVAANAGLSYFVGSAHRGHGELSGRLLPENVFGPEAGREGLFIAGVPGSYDEVTHFFGVRDPAVNDRLDRLMVGHVLEDIPRFATKLMLNGLEFYLPIVFPLLRGSAPSPLERIHAAPGSSCVPRSTPACGCWPWWPCCGRRPDAVESSPGSCSASRPSQFPISRS